MGLLRGDARKHEPQMPDLLVMPRGPRHLRTPPTLKKLGWSLAIYPILLPTLPNVTYNNLTIHPPLLPGGTLLVHRAVSQPHRPEVAQMHKLRPLLLLSLTHPVEPHSLLSLYFSKSSWKRIMIPGRTVTVSLISRGIKTLTTVSVMIYWLAPMSRS